MGSFDDKFGTSHRLRIFVIPVKTGPAIGGIKWVGLVWIPACTGMTTFYGFIKIDH